MSSLRSLILAVFVAQWGVGCGNGNSDPRHIDLSDFDSGKQLGDTLARLYPAGSRVAEVKEAMQRDGIYCYERGQVGPDGHVRSVRACRTYCAWARTVANSSSAATGWSGFPLTAHVA